MRTRFELFLIFIFLITLAPVCFAKPSSSAPQINLDFFENFQDENLLPLVIEGLSANKDVIIARKNISISKKERDKNISRLFPNLATGADYALIKLPKSAIPRNDIQTNSFVLPFVTAWEIDYLGENVNKITKAKLDAKNAEISLFEANLLLVSDLAAAYFNACSIQAQIEIQNKIIENSTLIYDKKSKMCDFGLISASERDLARQDLIFEENQLQALYKEKEIFLTQIAFLLGKPPFSSNEIKINPITSINYKAQIPQSLEASVICLRPDILRLENELKKAKIDIMIARKYFLPKMTVFGAMVFSTIVQNFGWKGVFAGLVAGVSQNIFDGGWRVFNLKQKKFEYEKMLETYLKCNLQALGELNNALYALKTDTEIFKNKNQAFDIENANFIRVFKSYNQGVASNLDYKSKEILKNKKEIDLINAKNRQFISLITLFKASGGSL